METIINNPAAVLVAGIVFVAAVAGMAITAVWMIRHQRSTQPTDGNRTLR